MTSTLVSEVIIDRPASHSELKDIPVEVDHTVGGGANIVIERPTLRISLYVSGAERISLIEALGGHDAHS